MWNNKLGAESDIVILTRVDIARNIKGFPFCTKMKAADKESVLTMVTEAAEGMNMTSLRLDQIGKEVKDDLYRKFMIDEVTYVNSDNKGVIFNEDEGIRVIINESEHIQIGVMSSGADIAKCYDKADDIASKLESNLDIAYSDKYGFLTSDIERMGTGIRITNLVFLPGIEKTTEAFTTLAKRLRKYDWRINPIKTPTGEKIAGIYCLYNVVSLGITEKDLITRAACVVDDVVKLERTCRTNICRRKTRIVEDQFYRAYAILRYARRIDSQEVYNLLSWLRLGCGNFEITEDINISDNKINYISQIMLRDVGALSKGRGTPMIGVTECADSIRACLKGDE